MFTDADIEMAELRQAAADADAGICSICGDALDPTHPKWAAEFPKADGTTAERWAELVGPVDTDLRLHRWCLSDNLI